MKTKQSVFPQDVFIFSEKVNEIIRTHHQCRATDACAPNGSIWSQRIPEIGFGHIRRKNGLIRIIVRGMGQAIADIQWRLRGWYSKCDCVEGLSKGMVRKRSHRMDILNSSHIEIMERVIHGYPDIFLARVANSQNITMLHDDAHLWNLFYPKDPSKDRIILFDWETCDYSQR